MGKWFARFWPRVRCNLHRHTEAVNHVRCGAEDFVLLRALHTSVKRNDGFLLCPLYPEVALGMVITQCNASPPVELKS
jgi:hypothetical protein